MNIHQPHDKLFKRTFGIKEVAVDFVSAHVAPKELKKLNLDTLKLQKDSFVDSNFKAFHSDVIYKVEGVEGKGYLYFLLEHQSTSDPFIVGRLLQYMGSIVEYDISQQLSIDPSHANLKIPAIYPFVVYSGREKYKWPKKLTIDIKGCSPLDLSSCLIELRGYDLDKLMKSGKAAVAQFVLKESWQKDFCKVLRHNPQLYELINNSPYAEDAILYMVDQDIRKDGVVKEIRNLDQKIKQNVMGNLAEIEKRGEQRGIKLGEQRGIKLGEQRGIKLGEQRGIKLGEQKGFKEAIFKLLAHGVDKVKAAQMLGLSLKKLENLIISTD